jgi:serine/threonine-protein kinase RsbW
VGELAFQLSLPALAENVIVVRQAAAGLGEAFGLADQRVDDLKTVVTEACNNVVLHAYGGEGGPLDVSAVADNGHLEVTIADSGRGFHPRPSAEEPSLGIGLPLIASLSDAFEVKGRAGDGTAITVCFAIHGDAADPEPKARGVEAPEELSMSILPGDVVGPVLSRVIGALAARAEFPVERLSDTMLLGDAVSSHPAEDFSSGSVSIEIRDAERELDVRVGPLVKGGGERLLSGMDVTGGEGSLRGLARSMEVTTEPTSNGEPVEFVVIAVAG